MRLLLELRDLRDVVQVDVRVDAEEPLEDHHDDLLEVLRKRDARLAREDRLVVQLVLDVRQALVDVVDRRQRDELLALLPAVLKVRPRAHHRARLRRAALLDRAKEQLDLLHEVVAVHRKPLVQVLARREEDRLLHLPNPQRLLHVLLKLDDLRVRRLLDVPDRFAVRLEKRHRLPLTSSVNEHLPPAARLPHRAGQPAEPLVVVQQLANLALKPKLRLRKVRVGRRLLEELRDVLDVRLLRRPQRREERLRVLEQVGLARRARAQRPQDSLEPLDRFVKSLAVNRACVSRSTSSLVVCSCFTDIRLLRSPPTEKDLNKVCMDFHFFTLVSFSIHEPA